MTTALLPIKISVPTGNATGTHVARVVDSAERAHLATMMHIAHEEVDGTNPVVDASPMSGQELLRIAFMKSCREMGDLANLPTDVVVATANKLYPDTKAVDEQVSQFGLRSATRPDVAEYLRHRSAVAAIQTAFSELFRNSLLRHLAAEEIEVVLSSNSMDGRKSGLDTFHVITINRLVPRSLNLFLFRIPLPVKRIPMAKIELANIAPVSIRKSTDEPFWTLQEGIVVRSVFYDPVFLQIAFDAVKLYDNTLKENGCDPYRDRKATYV